MKNLFLSVFLTTLFSSTGFAQTSIYKAPVTGPAMGTQRVELTYCAIFDIPTPIS